MPFIYWVVNAINIRDYLLAVKPFIRIIFNWLLISIMVMLPLRTVLSANLSNCDMPVKATQQITAHNMHQNHIAPDIAQDGTHNSHDCCCCEDNTLCDYDCSISMNASFIIHAAITIPTLHATSFRTHVEKTLVFRALIPPARPPENLHS